MLLKTLWHEYQIMNSNIISHNNITTKSWMLIFVMTMLQLKFFKTITTNNRALVYHGLYDSAAGVVSHATLNIPGLLWKEFKSREEQILHAARQPSTINRSSIVDCFDSNKQLRRGYVSETLNNYLNKFLFMIILL